MNRTYLTVLDAFNHEMSEALLDVDTTTADLAEIADRATIAVPGGYQVVDPGTFWTIVEDVLEG